MRSRVLNLSRLHLFPRFFGQDITKVFKQRYTGTITIVPKMSILQVRERDVAKRRASLFLTNLLSLPRVPRRSSQVLGIKALLNPTVEDMQHYLKNGAQAAWPWVEFIRHSVKVEEALRVTIER